MTYKIALSLREIYKLYYKNIVPDSTYTENVCYTWLASQFHDQYMGTDCDMINSNYKTYIDTKRGHYFIKNTNREFLLNIQKMLQRLGKLAILKAVTDKYYVLMFVYTKQCEVTLKEYSENIYAKL